VNRLQDALHSITDPSAVATSSQILDNLSGHAYKTLAITRQLDSLPWRRLFTETCLLRSLADIASLNANSESIAESAVARLDQALIIAGAPGDGRYDLIIELISKIQSDFLPSTPYQLSVCDDTSFSKAAQNPSLVTSSLAISRLSTPPSLSAFKHNLFKTPFIISDFAADWPAMSEHPWRSFEYLRFVAGRGRIVPVEVGRDYRTEDWSQQLMKWEDFLDSLESQNNQPHSVLYLAQHDLFKQFPALENDIVKPDYVFTAPAAPKDYPDYNPPGNAAQLVMNAWLGPAGTISPAHTVCTCLPMTGLIRKVIVRGYSRIRSSTFIVSRRQMASFLLIQICTSSSSSSRTQDSLASTT